MATTNDDGLSTEDLNDLAQDEYMLAVDGQERHDRPCALRDRADRIASGDARTLRAMGWASYSRATRKHIAAELRRMANLEEA